jgi:hypothetical protein
MVLAVRVCTEGQQWERKICARLPPREGVCHWLAGVTTRAAGYHQLSRGSSIYLDENRPRDNNTHCRGPPRAVVEQGVHTLGMWLHPTSCVTPYLSSEIAT